MSLRHYSEYSTKEGMAVEAAYKSRAEAVKAKTQEIATKPSEVIFLIDDEIVAGRVAALMLAYFTPGGDILDEAMTLCKLLERGAATAAELEVPEVDEEAIEAQLRGDR